MRAAPPVQLACSLESRWALGVGLLAGVSAATFAAWLCAHAALASEVTLAAAVAAGGLAAAAAWRHAARTPQRRLAWDGRAWSLDGAPGDVELVLDAGDWLLLRWQDGGRARWLPLTPRRCGAPLHLACAALLAHAVRRAGPSAGGFGRHG